MKTEILRHTRYKYMKTGFEIMYHTRKFSNLNLLFYAAISKWNKRMNAERWIARKAGHIIFHTRLTEREESVSKTYRYYVSNMRHTSFDKDCLINILLHYCNSRIIHFSNNFTIAFSCFIVLSFQHFYHCFL